MTFFVTATHMLGHHLSGKARLCVLKFLCLIIVSFAFTFYDMPSALADDAPQSQPTLSNRNVVVIVPENWPPQYILDQDGNPSGFAVDVMNEVAKIAELNVKYLIKPNFSKTVDALKAGEGDIIPNSGIAKERLDTYAFTPAVETFNIVMFTRSNSHGVENEADLVGKTVGVVEKNVGLFMFKDRTDVILQIYRDAEAALFGLLSSQVDVVIYPDTVFNALALKSGLSDKIQIVGKSLREIPRGMRVMKERVALNAVLSDAVNKFLVSPQYKTIYTKWYGESSPFWTTTRVIWSFGILALISVILWIITLRRAVSVRTAKIDLNEETLHFISQRGWEETGEAFFNSLVNYLGETLNVDYAIIDILCPDGKTARTVSLYALGQIPDNIEYALEWTPCENVIGKSYCCYPKRIKELFPKDTLLVDMGAESYAGIPLWDSQRNPIGLIAVLDRKPLVNTDSVKTVLQIVAVRAAHELERMLVEESLTSAKSEAEKANNAKSEFLASMSHDLRTPLNAIMGFSDMIRQKAFGPIGNDHYEEYAEDIYNSGTLLVSLINDVLDLSKVESGKYDLYEEALNIDEIIQTSAQLLDKMAERSEQNLSIDIAPKMPQLLGDKRVMTQILNNLISNAIKFTPHGGSINISAFENDKNSINICITDTGVGMSPENLKKVLLPFEQADGLHSRRHEGTGLGLHLCVTFMKLFGGALVIESVIGEGTKVTMSFPPERTIMSA